MDNCNPPSEWSDFVENGFDSEIFELTLNDLKVLSAQSDIPVEELMTSAINAKDILFSTTGLTTPEEKALIGQKKILTRSFLFGLAVGFLGYVYLIKK